MSHRVVWVDLPLTDLDLAIRFSPAGLGLAVTKEGGPGFTFGLLPHGEGEVGGCLVVPGPDDAPSKTGPWVYLNAEGRLAEAVAAVPARGGRGLQPVPPMGPRGFRAVALDTKGNRIALHALAH